MIGLRRGLPHVSSSGVHQVFIRSDRGVARLGDNLAPEELHWLLQAVQAMCVRS